MRQSYPVSSVAGRGLGAVVVFVDEPLKRMHVITSDPELPIAFSPVAEKVLPALSVIVSDTSSPIVTKLAVQIAACIYPMIYRSM